MNDITTRFLEFYEYLIFEKIIKNKSDFAKKLGVSSSSLTEIWKKRSNIGANIIQNTVSTFNFINSEWLLTGYGEMLKNGGNVNQNIGTGANIIQNGNGKISGTINIGGESHTKKSLEERLKGMVHEIRNLRTQIDNLTKIIEEKERLIETKNEIIELLRSK